MISLNRSLEIMEYIIFNKCAGVSEIAQAFQINKSTASRILSVLASHNLICKEENTMKYYPDIGTLLYSSRVMVDYRIADTIHPLLNNLSEKINMTSQVCILKGNRVVLIDQVKGRSNRFVKEPALPGMSEPLHCSAIGKCMLAYLSEEECAGILENYEMTKYTENTITDKEVLLKELETIRQKGYALDMGELYDNLYCMALPVKDVSEKISFSVGVSGNKLFLENEALFSFVYNEVKKVTEKIAEAYTTGNIE